MTIDLQSNLRSVQQRIADAATRAGRNPRDITLVAVSKTFPAESVLAVHALGIRHFGENRIEEAQDKIPQVMHQLPNYPTTQLSNITWHLVGHLQSRKVKAAVELFDFVQSVDTVALAKRLNDRAVALGKTLPIMLEVNVSGEPSKYGFAPAPRETFFAAVHDILALPNLDLQGLMTIAPIVAHADDARPHFRALRVLRDELRGRFPDHAWPHLSMGMTDDFAGAITEGATIVRIGRAIFGERK
jgi:pyridoxal phosphate enzyme (YggS family)